VARASNRYPNKLVIDIQEREPFALLNKDPIVILDQSGYVLPDVKNLEKYDIPVLSKFNDDDKLYPHGEKSLSIKVQKTISWLRSLHDKYPKFYYDISEILLENGDEIVIILNEYPTKIFLGNSNTLQKIEILKKFEETIKNIKKITDYAYLDIRYNNQVVAKEF
jgi:cell division septal protein FtsQ